MVDSGYLKRLKDLENPLKEDSQIFLPPRPVDPNVLADKQPQYIPNQNVKVRLLPPVLTQEERTKQRTSYEDIVKLPATTTLTTFSRFDFCPPTKKWQNQPAT